MTNTELRAFFKTSAFKRLHDNIDLVWFGQWLGQNGWQQYDHWERWINQGEGNRLMTISELYHEWKAENPESSND